MCGAFKVRKDDQGAPVARGRPDPQARRIVYAVPPTLLTEIDFKPPLPAERLQVSPVVRNVFVFEIIDTITRRYFFLTPITLFICYTPDSGVASSHAVGLHHQDSNLLQNGFLA